MAYELPTLPSPVLYYYYYYYYYYQLLFLADSPTPLLSFVLPMMKLSKSIHYMAYELMIKNL
jgi:hypothetical protein